MATLSETNQDLRTENEQLRSQRSSALIKEEGVLEYYLWDMLCGVRGNKKIHIIFMKGHLIFG